MERRVRKPPGEVHVARRAPRRQSPRPAGRETARRRRAPSASGPRRSARSDRAAPPAPRRAPESPCSPRSGPRSAAPPRRLPIPASRRTRAPSAGVARASTAGEIQRVRDDAHALRRDAEMRADGGLERAIGGDHAVGRARARQDRASKRQVRRALQPRPRRIGRAELLQPLRIEDERRARAPAASRVSEHARAEAVHEIDGAPLDELPGGPPGALAEQRIRGAAIEHGRPPAAGEREGAIRHEPHVDARIDRLRPRPCSTGVRVMSVTSTPRRARGTARDRRRCARARRGRAAERPSARPPRPATDVITASSPRARCRAARSARPRPASRSVIRRGPCRRAEAPAQRRHPSRSRRTSSASSSGVAESRPSVRR